MARALLMLGAQKKLRILCAREFQSSISDSVYKLLVDTIQRDGLKDLYWVTRNGVYGTNGTEFLFKGLNRNVMEIKSTEGVDICWVEEAQNTSEDSWQILIPTIRKEGSEIWISFNPNEESDPTYQRFVLHTPPNAVLHKVNYTENPWFPEVLREEMEYMRRVDPEGYAHVWEGELRIMSDALIFKNKYSIKSFATPEDARFYFGADWGFANDPTAIIRCFIQDNCLYIDREAYGIGVDIDDLARHEGEYGRSMFDEIPESRRWPIYADSARPETISYVKQRGFQIKGAEKWKGSIEDGIAYLRSFEKIFIHERCKHMIQEASLYKYKIDNKTGDILPVIEDKNNHCWDAVRYALSPYIKNRGAMRISPEVLKQYRRFS